MGTKVTEQGQIPKRVQDQLGGPGSEVTFRRAPDGSVIIEKAAATTPLDPNRFATLRGIADAGLSTDEIMAMTRGDANAKTTRLHPDRLAEAIGSAGPGPSTDEWMVLLRGEPE